MKNAIASLALGLTTLSAGAAEIVPLDVRADAGFNIVTDKTRRAVRQVGIPDSLAVMSRSAGKTDGVPLRVALLLLMPEGWHAVTTADVDTDALVGWQSEISWLDALDQIGLATDNQIIIDWSGKRVGVRSFSDTSEITWGRAPR